MQNQADKFSEDEVLQQGLLDLLYFIFPHVTALQVRVERCESINADKLSLDAKFGSFVQIENKSLQLKLLYITQQVPKKQRAKRLGKGKKLHSLTDQEGATPLHKV